MRSYFRLTAMAQLLDGTKVAQSIYQKLGLDLSLLGVVPKIVFFQVGTNTASETYIRSKSKKCLDLGLRSETIALPENTTEEELLSQIRRANENRDVHGILVQLPLPPHLSKWKVFNEISPLKDVDGLHPDNVGRLWQGQARFIPCTPHGILELLRFYQIPIQSKKTIILGRSDIVGKPMASLLLNENATVTLCHSKTSDLESLTKSADLLIVAIGKPLFIGPTFVKEGAVVIDVGIHRLDGRLVGDVNFQAVSEKVSALTPVPGGVGPLTIAMLMKNLVQAATLQNQRPSSR